ncbi:lipopolysaccharide biosynthesis protein [Spirosoma sp.]|uniref:lipopolysaccharide biosynthesis protein n=1 Tax=Spirosoma sp. TaxID=1899569 RepID=UPI00262A8379|nr:lipopolysaccharide biosynthesis protein [Spirosoma sp.]MCX6214042.1 lipopolysaccharide biosynthesis protein [Spirosoma sp.]
MSVTEDNKQRNTEEDEIEIRLSDIVQFLRNSRKAALIGGVVMLLIGALYAFSKPNQYSAFVTVMPEIQSKAGGLGGLSSLAGLAGIDIGSSSMGGSVDAIRPDVYPNVLQSVPFALHLLQQPVYSQLLKKETSLQTFFEEQDGQSWFGKSSEGENDEKLIVLDPNNRSKTLQITKKQEEFILKIHEAVSATFDKKTAIITVSATLPDPVVAATTARLSLEYLTNYIVSYRTEKARNQVQFLTNQVNDAKSRYQRAEYALSSYRDRNRNVFLETAKIEEQRIQAEFLLTQSVYTDLSKQLEQAKIKVAEESPVFKVLEPSLIPLKKSGPKRTVIILGFAVIGVLLGIVTYGISRFRNSTK